MTITFFFFLLDHNFVSATQYLRCNEWCTRSYLTLDCWLQTSLLNLRTLFSGLACCICFWCKYLPAIKSTCHGQLFFMRAWVEQCLARLAFKQAKISLCSSQNALSFGSLHYNDTFMQSVLCAWDCVSVLDYIMTGVQNGSNVGSSSSVLFTVIYQHSCCVYIYFPCIIPRQLS